MDGWPLSVNDGPNLVNTRVPRFFMVLVLSRVNWNCRRSSCLGKACAFSCATPMKAIPSRTPQPLPHQLGSLVLPLLAVELVDRNLLPFRHRPHRVAELLRDLSQHHRRRDRFTQLLPMKRDQPARRRQCPDVPIQVQPVQDSASKRDVSIQQFRCQFAHYSRMETRYSRMDPKGNAAHPNKQRRSVLSIPEHLIHQRSQLVGGMRFSRLSPRRAAAPPKPAKLCVKTRFHGMEGADTCAMRKHCTDAEFLENGSKSSRAGTPIETGVSSL